MMKKTISFSATALLLAACTSQPAATNTDAATNAAAPATTGNAATMTNAAAPADAAATGSTARCVVLSIPADERYEGPCSVDSIDDAVAGRSFVATPPAGKSFPIGMTEVIVQADTPTAANLSVRTSDGELSDGDVARREGNCWSTETEEICVTRS